MHNEVWGCAEILPLKGTVTPPLCVCELGGGGVGERVKRDILESKE